MSRKRSLRDRVGLAALPLVLIPIILLGVATQVRVAPKRLAADIPQPPPKADYYLRGAEVSSMDENGELLYRVHAANVLHFPDQSISMAKVQVAYLNGPWTLDADTGHIPPGEQTLQLSGDVKMRGTLRSGESVNLSTDDITVKFDERQIETLSAVQMNSDTVSATSQGLRTDMAGRELHLLSQVKVRYEP